MVEGKLIFRRYINSQGKSYYFSVFEEQKFLTLKLHNSNSNSNDKNIVKWESIKLTLGIENYTISSQL